jgi:putative addiction module component (TIGR02574 family)
MNAILERRALELLGLPIHSRALLAEKLLASLEDESESEEVAEAWKKEALRRYKAMKSGKTKAHSHAEVMRDARKLLKKK